MDVKGTTQALTQKEASNTRQQPQRQTITTPKPKSDQMPQTSHL